MSDARRLERRLRDRILAGGPITFAAFMEAALYDPHGGYYTRPPVGEEGDFVTSAHVSPAFGVLLARCVEDLWIRLDRPDPFLLVEAGAGDGTLARRLLASLPEDLAAVTTFVAVERSPGARVALATLLGGGSTTRMVKMTDDLARAAPDASVPGIILANELLDNLPFHRLRGTSAGIVELFVGVDDVGFVLVEAPPTHGLVPLAPKLNAGDEAVVSPEAFAFLDRAAGLVSRGYALIVDYASTAGPRTLVHGYRGHRVEADVLAAPGTRDITAAVDFGALARHAQAIGVQAWGPLSQRDALVNLGYLEWERALRDRQTRALNDGRGREAAQIYSARNRARLLIDPAGLGRFEVLCLGVGRAPRPALLLDGSRS